MNDGVSHGGGEMVVGILKFPAIRISVLQLSVEIEILF